MTLHPKKILKNVTPGLDKNVCICREVDLWGPLFRGLIPLSIKPSFNSL